MYGSEDEIESYNFTGSSPDKRTLLDAMHKIRYGHIMDDCNKIGLIRNHQLSMVNYNKRNEIDDKSAKKEQEAYEKHRLKKGLKRVTLFKHSLYSCVDLLVEIEKIDKAMNQLSNISISKEMIKEDKNVAELNKRVRKIGTALYSYRKKCSKQVLEDIKNMNKTWTSVPQEIHHEESIFLFQAVKKASTITYIPEQYDRDDYKTRQLKEKKKEIDKKYDTKEDISERDINEIFEELGKISSSMIGLEDKELKDDIKTEMTSIRRAVKPKNMSISKENLEKMRKSEKLVVDVERLKSAFDTTYFHTKGSKQSRRINKKIKKLKEFTSKVVISQNKTKSKLSNEQWKIDDKVGFANDALKTYHRAVDQSREIQDAEARARRINESIDDDIDKLRDRKDYLNKYKSSYNEKETKEEIRDINDKIDDKKTAQVKNTEEAKIKSRKKVSLPEKYSNMKEKLKNQSNLRKAIMSSSYDMGGMQL